MVQNNFYCLKIPNRSCLANKDNNIIPNNQKNRMNMEINKVIEKNNFIDIIKNNEQNLNLNNNMDTQKITEENSFLKNEISDLKKVIKLKDEEIKELKSKVDILSSKIDKNHKFVDYENIKIIQFLSLDHSLIYSIKCLPSDTFAEVEEKLYKKYPDYRETNNVFQIDGRNILRFKTIAENNIPDGHYVQISKIE